MKEPPAPEALDALARLAEPPRHDRYSELALRRALEEYRPRRREAVAPVRFEVDGAGAQSLYGPLADRARPFAELTLTVDAPAEEDGWAFLDPVRSVRIRADGRAEFVPPSGPPEPAVARLLLREQFQPMGEPVDGAPPRLPGGSDRPELFTPPALARYLRRHGVVPFALGVAVYRAAERSRYEIDLLDGLLLADPRRHHLAPARRVHRPSRVGHAVDAIVARGQLSLPSARALEVLTETNGLSAVDIAPMFGGVRELASSALESLAARGYLAFDRRRGLYRPRLEALVRSPDASPGPVRGRAPPGNPRLRASVMELLAAAESRATCPLCGDPRDGRAPGLLCARCAALVGHPPAPG